MIGSHTLLIMQFYVLPGCLTLLKSFMLDWLYSLFKSQDKLLWTMVASHALFFFFFNEWNAYDWDELSTVLYVLMELMWALLKFPPSFWGSFIFFPIYSHPSLRFVCWQGEHVNTIIIIPILNQRGVKSLSVLTSQTACGPITWMWMQETLYKCCDRSDNNSVSFNNTKCTRVLPVTLLF